MKKHFILALLGLTALTSCTDNDTEDTNPNEAPMLHKTITYFPGLENFETRNVKYYEDNKIVADSTYDSSGNFISRAIHTYNSSNYTIDVKDADNVTIAAAAEEYDTQGRLIAFFNYGQNYTYTYEGNNISVDYLDPAGAFINIGMFTMNGDGFITTQTELQGDVISNATSLGFSGNTKPVSLMALGTTGTLEELGTFSYYPNNMPANLEKSTLQINNEVLKAFKLEAAALTCNYHLQDIIIGGNSVYHSDTTFNPATGYEGYPQYQTISIAGQPFCHIHYLFQN